MTPFNLYSGPAGWQRPDWDEIVGWTGPRRREHPLAALAKHVDLAEIEQTYLEPLKPEIARLYVRKVEANPRFLFTALLGRRFTYDRELAPEAVEAWKAGLRPLAEAGRLGALILEFPWAFRFSEENRQFLIRLRREFHEFPLAAEFRHDSWHSDEAVTTLIHHRVPIVNLDQPSWYRAMPPAAMLTAGLSVVRLHGRRSPDSFREFDAVPDRGYLYSLDELLEWRPRLERLAANCSRVLVVTTNSDGGGSLVNALQVKEILGERRLTAPAPLIAAYPAELAGFRGPRPVQQALPGVRAA